MTQHHGEHHVEHHIEHHGEHAVGIIVNTMVSIDIISRDPRGPEKSRDVTALGLSVRVPGSRLTAHLGLMFSDFATRTVCTNQPSPGDQSIAVQPSYEPRLSFSQAYRAAL